MQLNVKEMTFKSIDLNKCRKLIAMWLYMPQNYLKENMYVTTAKGVPIMD